MNILRFLPVLISAAVLKKSYHRENSERPRWELKGIEVVKFLIGSYKIIIINSQRNPQLCIKVVNLIEILEKTKSKITFTY
jgi:hypothetical protein